MIRAIVTAVAVAVALAGSAAHAQPVPPAMANVGVDERVGERIPLDLWFSDAAGRRIQLGELFDGKPVLLALTYVRCRMLCSVVLHGLTDAIRALPLELGRDYRVITVSIDPREDAASAAARRRELLARLGLADDAAWSYLVGAERPIQLLADRLGFRYAWDARSEQFAHPAVVFVLLPDGRIAHYFHGVQYPAPQLAATLRRAAGGELSPGVAESVLACFKFDPALRAHRERIERYLRIGAAGVMLALGSTIVVLFLWERRRRT